MALQDDPRQTGFEHTSVGQEAPKRSRAGNGLRDVADERDVMRSPEDDDARDALQEDAVAEIEEPGPISDGSEVAAQPTTTIVGEEEKRETFIPLTRFAIIEKLCDPSVWTPGDVPKVRDFFKCLGAVRNLSYTQLLLELKEVYLPFSPDRDTVRALTFTPEEFTSMQGRLTGLLRRILTSANYREITPAILEQIFEEKSAYGLDLSVDLAEFDELMVFSRGATVKQHTFRQWKTLWLKKHSETVPIFQRLFLLLKLKPEDVRLREIMVEEDIDEKQAAKRLKKLRQMLPEQASSDFVYLKMFKQIPRADLQMMFPNTRVKFKLADKLFLGATAGGGTIASVVTTISKLALVATNPLKALAALVGLVAVIFRQVKKFFTQKNAYMMTLAQNLYFHNLADNRGVLTLLTDRAEEEDVKEEMLLYALLARGPLPRAELDDARQAIEQFLEEEFGVAVQFDAEDALSRLLDNGIVAEDGDGVLRTRAPSDGAAHLRAQWNRHLAEPDATAPDTEIPAT
ncbi:MAG: TMEM143 family protein [Pseudomonadota bacterium]